MGCVCHAVPLLIGNTCCLFQFSFVVCLLFVCLLFVVWFVNSGASDRSKYGSLSDFVIVLTKDVQTICKDIQRIQASAQEV
jgi:hypothetical protein